MKTTPALFPITFETRVYRVEIPSGEIFDEDAQRLAQILAQKSSESVNDCVLKLLLGATRGHEQTAAPRFDFDQPRQKRAAIALGFGYLAGLSGRRCENPFWEPKQENNHLWSAWEDGRRQGREHRARFVEGDASIVSSRTIEAALIRLGKL